MTTLGASDPQHDRALLDRAVAGDALARVELGERLQVVPRLLAAIHRRQRARLSRQDLEDAGQEVLALVWKKHRLFQGVGSFEAWLYRFCLLTYRYHARRNVRGRAAPGEELSQHVSEQLDNDHDPGIDLERIETSLRALGPPFETVVRLKHEDGLSFEEIGARLAIPVSTAKTRYYDGIKWLRDYLVRHGGVR